jgi:hypothetical protein
MAVVVARCNGRWIVLEYLGSLYKISHSWVDVLTFLRPFIWSLVSGLMQFRDGSNKGTASNCVQILEKMWQGPWQWLDKHSGKKAWAVHRKSKLTKTKKERQIQSKVKSMLVLFFDIKGIVHKEFILAGQKVNSAYREVSRLLHENVWRFHPKRWQQKNWLLHHDNAPSHTSFLTTFGSQTSWLSSPTHATFLFPRSKVKLKGHHFDTIEVSEAESKAVLNTLHLVSTIYGAYHEVCSNLIHFHTNTSYIQLFQFENNTSTFMVKLSTYYFINHSALLFIHIFSIISNKLL